MDWAYNWVVCSFVVLVIFFGFRSYQISSHYYQLGYYRPNYMLPAYAELFILFAFLYMCAATTSLPFLYKKRQWVTEFGWWFKSPNPYIFLPLERKLKMKWNFHSILYPRFSAFENLCRPESCTESWRTIQICKIFTEVCKLSSFLDFLNYFIKYFSWLRLSQLKLFVAQNSREGKMIHITVSVVTYAVIQPFHLNIPEVVVELWEARLPYWLRFVWWNLTCDNLLG